MLQHLDDPTPLPASTPDYQAAVHRRGTQLRRRRTGIAIGAPLVATALVAAAVLWSVSPARTASTVTIPTTAQSPTPAWTATPDPAATTPASFSACGHGAACPEGAGPFRIRMTAGESSWALVAHVTLPPGYSIAEAGNGGFLISPSRDQDAGLSVLWPVHGKIGGDDAHAVATALAALPSSRQRTPTRVDFGGDKVGWRVLLRTAGTDRDECIDPTRGLYADENYLGFDQTGTPCTELLQHRIMGDPQNPVLRTPVGTNRAGLVEVTLFSGLGAPTPPGADMLSFWRWGPDLDTAPTAELIDQIQFTRGEEPPD